MKTKDYIRILGIKKGWIPSKRTLLLSLLTIDFEYSIKNIKMYDRIQIFDEAVIRLKSKWNSISNSIPGGLPYIIWKYFEDTVIIPSREKYCPNYTAEKKKQQKEFEERLFEAVFEFYNDSYNNNFEDFFNQIPHEITKPDNAFAYFGLSSNATKDDVLIAFHTKILLVHPDKGGTNEEAAECIKMKDLCLNYLNKKL